MATVQILASSASCKEKSGKGESRLGAAWIAIVAATFDAVVFDVVAAALVFAIVLLVIVEPV